MSTDVTTIDQRREDYLRRLPVPTVEPGEGNYISEQDDGFDILVEVERRLTAFTTVMEAKGFADEARSLQVYARRARKGLEVQNRCALVRVLAELRAGELLVQLEREPGKRDEGETCLQRAVRLANLAEGTAHRWMVMAAVPPAVVKQMWEKADLKNEELLSGPVYKLGQQIRAGLKRADLSGRVGPTQEAVFNKFVERLEHAVPNDYLEFLSYLPLQRLSELYRAFKDVQQQVERAMTDVTRQTHTEMEDVLVPHIWPPRTGEGAVKDFGHAVRVFVAEAELVLNARVLLTESEMFAQLNAHILTARQVLDRLAGLMPMETYEPEPGAAVEVQPAVVTSV